VLPDVPTVEWIDASAKVALVERVVPPAWAGHRALDLDADGDARVVSVTRLGVAQVAGSDLLLQDGDVIHVALAGDGVDAFDARLATDPKEDHR
jgi:trk system potassium uptake protein TrkA